MVIDSSMLRLTWSVVEETPTSDLLSLTDTALIKLLLQQIAGKILLSGEEVCALYSYIGSKMTLIRDIAESRRTLHSISSPDKASSRLSSNKLAG
ncbi:hypothetical protein LC593_06750 [Nostoc sp. CHAB 5844]|nr:hypothetical protein [Nostoc sp. CHAB 5844]